jgi:hypothetical protein
MDLPPGYWKPGTKQTLTLRKPLFWYATSKEDANNERLNLHYMLPPHKIDQKTDLPYFIKKAKNVSNIVDNINDAIIAYLYP